MRTAAPPIVAGIATRRSSGAVPRLAKGDAGKAAPSHRPTFDGADDRACPRLSVPQRCQRRALGNVLQTDPGKLPRGSNRTRQPGRNERAVAGREDRVRVRRPGRRWPVAAARSAGAATVGGPPGASGKQATGFSRTPRGARWLGGGPSQAAAGRSSRHSTLAMSSIARSHLTPTHIAELEPP